MLEYGCLVSKQPCLPYLRGKIRFENLHDLCFGVWILTYRVRGASARVRFAWLLIASLFMTLSFYRSLSHWLRDSFKNWSNIYSVHFHVCIGIRRKSIGSPWVCNAFWLWCDTTAWTFHELWRCGYWKLIEIVLFVALSQALMVMVTRRGKRSCLHPQIRQQRSALVSN